MTASTVRKKGIRDVFEILHHSRYFLEFKYFPIIYELEKLVFLENIANGAKFRKHHVYLFFLLSMRSCVPICSFKLPNLVFLFPRLLLDFTHNRVPLQTFIYENPYCSKPERVLKTDFVLVKLQHSIFLYLEKCTRSSIK